MPAPRVTVVVPTLTAGETLRACLNSLENQTFRDFEAVVVDNSGIKVVARLGLVIPWLRVIENPDNVGFGAAINQGTRATESEFVATLNDDAEAQPGWLSALVGAIEPRYEIGMCASRVALPSGEGLDSAGMLLCADGSSKQRGHGEQPDGYPRLEEVMFPSGSAALYRRDMLVETGGFDESFFLFCEDTDLGLRARWAGWECLYVPGAQVEHRYSHSAGRASALKAFYVERNRLFVALKNFPRSMLWRVPFVSLARYFWHFIYARRGSGAAGQFSAQGGTLAQLSGCIWKAHTAALANWKALLTARRRVRRRLTPKQFAKMAAQHSISARQVAAL